MPKKTLIPILAAAVLGLREKVGGDECAVSFRFETKSARSREIANPEKIIAFQKRTLLAPSNELSSPSVRRDIGETAEPAPVCRKLRPADLDKCGIEHWTGCFKIGRIVLEHDGLVPTDAVQCERADERFVQMEEYVFHNAAS